MKALLSRFNRGLSGKPKDDNQQPNSNGNSKHKSVQLPPLSNWPPSTTTSPRPSQPSPSRSTHKPLPDPNSSNNNNNNSERSGTPPPLGRTINDSSEPPQSPTKRVRSPLSPQQQQQLPAHDLESSQATTATHVDDADGPASKIAPSTSTSDSSSIAAPVPIHASPPSAMSDRDQERNSAGRSSGGRLVSSRAGTNPKSIDTNANGTLRERDERKVAFRSPPPSPGPDAALLLRSASRDDVMPSSGAGVGVGPGGSTVSLAGPMKSQTSRFQGQHGHGPDPRGSTSTQASSSRTNVGSNGRAAGSAVKLVSTTNRSATSPYPRDKNDAASMHQSVRSGTPYSQAGSAFQSEILAVTSWSEAAEDDLVSNLGPRERTRQEVLWEIVASEERYVIEIQKMKDTFIDPLLHPYSTSPLTSPGPSGIGMGMSSSSAHGHGNYDYLDEPNVRSDSPQESLDYLPIAARFLSPTLGRDTPAANASGASGDGQNQRHRATTPHMGGDSDSDEEADQMGRSGPPTSPSKAQKAQLAKHGHPRSPYRGSTQGNQGTTASRATAASGTTKGGVTFPSRSHQSLPPPPRMNPTSSTASLGRQSFVEKPGRGESSSGGGMGTAGRAGAAVLRKFKKSNPQPSPFSGSNGDGGRDGIAPGGGVAPHLLPEDLKKCLEVIETAIMDGHNALSKGLRKRYDEQYPLVRSLADVFVAHSHILHGYATYVLHLERALEEVDAALATAAAKKPKPKSSKATPDDWLRLCAHLRRLEESAAERGETGLAISLSKPFQRLLKYPLLFQNLLYHTDPSTFEYESTLQMVAEVETIVRSIEDEKIQKEERDKTRDVVARIEGLEKVKGLSAPKPSRLLMEERALFGVQLSPGSSSPPVIGKDGKAVKGKTSFKRLSDVLGGGGSGGIGGKKDLWLVVFNDVVLRCQRIGQTSLPMAGGSNPGATRTNSMPDMAGRAKYATTGRRHGQTRPRNLYRFVKIETWAIADVVQPRHGVVSMEDVARTRQGINNTGGVQPRIIPMPDDDDERDGGMDSDDSDRKSKMSFSYWGADKVTLQKPIVKPKPPPSASAMSGGGSGSGGNGSGSGANGLSGGVFGGTLGGGPHAAGGRTKSGTAQQPAAYGRESSANAKFGTRLVSDSPNPGVTALGMGAAARTASRRAAETATATRTAASGATTTTTTRRPTHAASEDGHGAGRATATGTGRPPWGGRVTPSNKATSTTTTTMAGSGSGSGGNGNGNGTTSTSTATRVRNTSQPSAVRSTKTPSSAPLLGSPAPSEDSGVGLYRQMMAKDPSLRDL